MAAKPRAGAILHTHSINATTLACLGRGIPPFHYMVAVAGGRDIRCAPYATFGTETLADAVLEALDGRLACLMANHGMLVMGRDIEDAFKRAVEIETLAEQYLKALAVGKPNLLTVGEMEVVLEKFKNYSAWADPEDLSWSRPHMKIPTLPFTLTDWSSRSNRSRYPGETGHAVWRTFESRRHSGPCRRLLAGLSRGPLVRPGPYSVCLGGAADQRA